MPRVNVRHAALQWGRAHVSAEGWEAYEAARRQAGLRFNGAALT